MGRSITVILFSKGKSVFDSLDNDAAGAFKATVEAALKEVADATKHDFDDVYQGFVRLRLGP